MKSFLFLASILIILSACSIGWNYVSAASPEYENLSDQPIYNIKVTSGKINLIGWPALSPGGSAYVSNFIKNKNDMYGNVTVSWRNASGKEFTRTFKFTKEDDKDAYITTNWKGENVKPSNVGSSLVFEFTQDNVEYYTSAAPDYWERGKRAANITSDIEYKIDKEKERKKYY
jgi:hypothetical protein